MIAEQDRVLEALRFAVRMEIDGKEYYLKVSVLSGNELGRKLLARLSDEGDIHRRKLVEIYNAGVSKGGWPSTDFQPDGGQRLRTIFATAIAEIGSSVKVLATEIDAIQTALGMESKSYDFYKSQAGIATDGAEKDFYDTIAGEEREHELVLLDYYEFLKDPAGWFVNKEHPSLDGS